MKIRKPHRKMTLMKAYVLGGSISKCLEKLRDSVFVVAFKRTALVPEQLHRCNDMAEPRRRCHDGRQRLRAGRRAGRRLTHSWWLRSRWRPTTGKAKKFHHGTHIHPAQCFGTRGVIQVLLAVKEMWLLCGAEGAQEERLIAVLRTNGLL